MPDADDRHDASSLDARDISSLDGYDAPSAARREAAPSSRRDAASPDAFAAPAAAALAADLRAPGEDDDGYDPYSDYMDAWGRMDDEEPCEDPWR